MLKSCIILLLLSTIAFSQTLPSYYCDISTGDVQSSVVADTAAVIGSNQYGYYKENIICVWYIQPSVPASSITFVFDRFDTEYQYDPVIFYDGLDTDAEINWFSGDSIPQTFSTPSGGATILFYSDQLITGQGFRLTYYANICPAACSGNGLCINNTCQCNAGWSGADCSQAFCPNNCAPNGVCFTDHDFNQRCLCNVGYYGGDCLSEFCDANSEYSADNGTFVDHHGGGEYRNNEDCRWLIQPSSWAPGDSISLTFSKFDIEQDYDFVTIYDGNSTNALEIGSFTGSSIPQTIIGISGSLFVVFTSDVGVVRTGFSASYAVVHCDPGCNGHGYCHFTGKCACDVGYTGDHCETRECYHDCWGNGNCVNGTTCVCNQGWDNIDCGICTGSNQFCPISYCAGIQTIGGDSGTFADHEGQGDYAPNSHCSWVIQAPTGKNIALQFTLVDLNEGDLVKIHDGGLTNHIVGVLTGTYDQTTISTIPTFISENSTMTIEFDSGFGNTRQGFSASYSTYQCAQPCVNGYCALGTCKCDDGWTGATCAQSYCMNNCSGLGLCINNRCECYTAHFGPDCQNTYCSGVKVVTAASGTIKDHSDGAEYLPNSNCGWQLSPRHIDPPLTVVFQKFQLESPYDFVAIYDGNSTGSLLATVSGSFIPDPILAPSGKAFVKFVSNSNTNFVGFTALYSTSGECPSNCTGQGFCIGGACACLPGFEGTTCNRPASGESLSIDSTISRSVASYSWSYFYYDIGNQITSNLTVIFEKESNYGHPEFYVNYNTTPTWGTHYGVNYYYSSDNSLRIINPAPGRWWIGVYGRSAAQFSLKTHISCSLNAQLQDGVCVCEPCHSGPTCSTHDDECNPTSESESGNGSSGRRKGAIAAIVVTIVVIGGAAGVVGFLFWRKRRMAASSAPGDAGIDLPTFKDKNVSDKKGFKQFEDEN